MDNNSKQSSSKNRTTIKPSIKTVDTNEIKYYAPNGIHLEEYQDIQPELNQQSLTFDTSPLQEPSQDELKTFGKIKISKSIKSLRRLNRRLRKFDRPLDLQ